jgi:hypothetical protein
VFVPWALLRLCYSKELLAVKRVKKIGSAAATRELLAVKRVEKKTIFFFLPGRPCLPLRN